VTPAPFDREALMVAMAIAPGAYARNRLFALHKDPEVRRAKARAAVLRGLVRQLSGAHGEVAGLCIERAHGHVTVRYRVQELHFERQAELSEVEAACLLYLGGRAGAPGLQATAEDRALLHAALRKLTPGLSVAGGATRGGSLTELLE